MAQQMNFEEIKRDNSKSSYTGYEGTPPYADYSSSPQGQKLSWQIASKAPSAAMRLALAIVSLITLLIVTFGLIGIGALLRIDLAGGIVLALLLMAFYATVAIINVVFNRH
ncbi:MAG: hypothetical protein JO125_16135 [Chloroflexi bacterium]|nr:hypothetical protein [Chloroflexota bacterium]